MKRAISTWVAIFAMAGPDALYARDQPAEPMPGGTAAMAPYGVVDPGRRWQRDTLWVCWRAGGARERQWVQEAVRDSWMAETGVQFVGWGDCPRMNDPAFKTTAEFIAAIRKFDIKIDTTSGQPLSDIGTEALKCNDLPLDNLDQCASMSLNFTFDGDWPTPANKQACLDPAKPDARKRCIQAIAVHEFGHAMGFQHEQLHPDVSTDPKCVEMMAHDSGATAEGKNVPTSERAPVTAYDKDSIMNYCNLLWWKGELSHNDKCTGRWLFKPPSDRMDTLDCTYLTSPTGA